jgi:hypothetical protein
MKRIDRTYAIVYVDNKGESLNSDVNDFATKEMISDYYQNRGFLQWNFYLIIPKEFVNKSDIKIIEENDIYTRKFVIEKDMIDSFIKERFPELNEKKGTIALIKGKNYKDGRKKAKKFDHNNPITFMFEGWYRNESLNYSLTEMDKLRARLIKEPQLHGVFYTHIDNEYSLAKKKFKLFKN